VSIAIFLCLVITDYINRRRIRRQAKKTSDDATARQSGSLTEQRNILHSRHRAWEEILPIYMPGLLQYQTTLESNSPSNPQLNSTPTVGHPEDAIIWLPSQIPSTQHLRVCYAGLADIEEKIRTAHCYDNLEAVRHVLIIKSRMVAFKNHNVRGQHDSTRSRTVIDRVHERAKVAAERYRVARHAKLALAGAGDWETALQVLNDGDIRGYQDLDCLRVRAGRKGTLEDGQVAVEVEEAEEMGDDVAEDNLWREVRHRRDGMERRATPSPGYGRIIQKPQTLMTRTTTSFERNGLRAEHGQQDAMRRSCC